MSNTVETVEVVHPEGVEHGSIIINASDYDAAVHTKVGAQEPTEASSASSDVSTSDTETAADPTATEPASDPAATSEAPATDPAATAPATEPPAETARTRRGSRS
jgi:hypothetical protein